MSSLSISSRRCSSASRRQTMRMRLTVSQTPSAFENAEAASGQAGGSTFGHSPHDAILMRRQPQPSSAANT
jgi:hypothetical protein